MAPMTQTTALVTGAVRGLGLAIAQALAARGIDVLLTDLAPADAPEVADALARLPPGCAYRRLDVTQEADWAAAVDDIRQRWDRLDILVNNAGVDAVGAVETVSLADWQRVIDINLTGVFLGIRACTDLLAASGPARTGGSAIVTISSIMGMVGFPNIAAYNASKGAVRTLSKGLAVEFATSGKPIRVNSVHPGFVRTPLLERGFQRMVDQGAVPSVEAMVAQVASLHPMGRLGLPEEIAAAVVFLASPEASFITGAELAVDGGYTAQ